MDGGRQTTDDNAGFSSWRSERSTVVVADNVLLDGRFPVDRRAERLELGEQGFALAIRRAERLKVIHVAAALHEMKTCDGLQERTDRYLKEASLFGIA